MEEKNQDVITVCKTKISIRLLNLITRLVGIVVLSFYYNDLQSSWLPVTQ